MPTAGYIDGKPACSCLIAWIPVFQKMIGRDVRWFQLNGDAPASAGFHKGGGSADCAPLSEKELRIARNMGGAAWNRWWTNNFHAHIRLNGCPHNTIAQPQVEDLNEGRDGTGPLYDNRGEADNGPRDGIKWPLRTWQQGIEWAETQMALTKDELALLKKAASTKDDTRWLVMENGGTRADGDTLADQLDRVEAKLDQILAAEPAAPKV